MCTDENKQISMQMFCVSSMQTFVLLRLRETCGYVHPGSAEKNIHMREKRLQTICACGDRYSKPKVPSAQIHAEITLSFTKVIYVNIQYKLKKGWLRVINSLKRFKQFVERLVSIVQVCKRVSSLLTSQQFPLPHMQSLRGRNVTCSRTKVLADLLR